MSERSERSERSELVDQWRGAQMAGFRLSHKKTAHPVGYAVGGG